MSYISWVSRHICWLYDDNEGYFHNICKKNTLLLRVSMSTSIPTKIRLITSHLRCTVVRTTTSPVHYFTYNLFGNCHTLIRHVTHKLPRFYLSNARACKNKAHWTTSCDVWAHLETTCWLNWLEWVLKYRHMLKFSLFDIGYPRYIYELLKHGKSKIDFSNVFVISICFTVVL